MATPFEIDVNELDRLRREGEPHAVLDVREPWEADICAIEGSILMPLHTLPMRAAELPTDRPLVVLCHHGGRSAQAVMFLRSRGMGNATNLEGGINAWAQIIDRDMRTY